MKVKRSFVCAPNHIGIECGNPCLKRAKQTLKPQLKIRKKNVTDDYDDDDDVSWARQDPSTAVYTLKIRHQPLRMQP